MYTNFPVLPLPSCYTPTPWSAPAPVHHGWGDRVIEKHCHSLLSQAGPPAAFHYWQQKERQSSQSDKHSRCVGWRQPSMEINLSTEHVLSCLSEK